MKSTASLDVSRLNDDVKAYLQDEACKLIYLQSCQSTNAECMQASEHGTVVLAERQTAGRGRRGRDWYSPASGNVYCSIGLNKSLPADFLGLISLLAGVSIAQVLEEFSYPDISLKWPNDILCQGKKLGGILIETQALAEDQFFLVIGFGLNINLDAKASDYIDQPAISLSMLGKQQINRQSLLAGLIGRIMSSIIGFEQQGALSLLAEFERFDAFRGRQVNLVTPSQTINATYLGLESNGQIRVRTEQGVQTFAAAEISLRQDTHAAD